MRGRINRNPAAAPPHPEQIVKAFLDAMENRNLEAAQHYLGEGFEMVFPADVSFINLKRWSAGQNTDIRKSEKSLTDLI